MTTAEATVLSLIVNGIDQIYCVPGIQNDVFFDALHKHQDKIRPIHTRHEQGAAYMALGAAMATGKPAAFVVAPGPGVLNTTAALSTAHAVNAPVLCITGQIPSAAIGRGLGILHDIPDQLGILRSLTKWADRINAPQEAGEKVTEAFRQMLSGRPRPVALECPIDVWPQQAPVVLGEPAKAVSVAIDPVALTRAAEMAARAKSPMIVVGSGAQDASGAIKDLAELLQAPVVSHRMGPGVLDSLHPLALVSQLGNRLWAETDCVIAVGTRLLMQLTEWGVDERLKIIRIDADPTEIGRVREPDLRLQGDAADIVGALLAAMPARAGDRPSRTEEMTARKAVFAKQAAVLQPQGDYLRVIREELPENGIFVDEMTQLGYAARLLYPVRRPRTFLSPGYQGTLGWGFATALGAKAALPDTPVVSVTGDGGFMFNVQELATAVQHKIPLVTVLVNDGAFGNVRRIQAEEYGARHIATELRNPNFVPMVESFGAIGVQARSPEELRQALRSGFAADLPTVIEIPAGSMPSPWPLIAMKRVRGPH